MLFWLGQKRPCVTMCTCVSPHKSDKEFVLSVCDYTAKGADCLLKMRFKPEEVSLDRLTPLEKNRFIDAPYKLMTYRIRSLRTSCRLRVRAASLSQQPVTRTGQARQT